MTLTPQLHRLAHAYGVQVGSFDMKGERRFAAPDTLLAVLSSMGAPVTRMADVPGALRERHARQARTLVEPVVVAWDGRMPPLELRLVGRQRSGLATAAFTLEDGEQRSVHHDLDELPLLHTGTVEGETVVTRTWATGLTLPLGYHRLRLTAGGRTAQALVLAAPERADSASLGPEHGLGPDSARAWGSFLPTYALRRTEDWGCGDYTALAQLVRWTGDHGGRAVATLPLLPSYFEDPLFEPSPYAPSSRRCWNELYIDPTAEPEWAESVKARALAGMEDWVAERDELRDADLLDYKRLWALKRPVLRAMSDSLHHQQGPRAAVLAAFLEERPHVLRYARFRAAVEARGTAWQEWPTSMRDGRLRDAELDPGVVRFWCYAQWIAHLQMGRVAADGKQRGTGLVLDLPLGVHSCGYDTWDKPALFAKGMSAGAPPDSFFTKGQCWGFPPRVPDAVRADGYSGLIATLRHHLEFATVLRIDHVMSLHRLYWVPHGLDATHGVYVRYSADEQYAVLNLESHRHGATIIGEDLGTVPRGVRPAMERHDIRRLRVGQFEVGGGALAAPNPRAVASLNTHDMPTFAAYRQGLDVDDLQELGMFDAPSARWEKAQRRRSLIEVRAWLVAEGLLEEDAPDDALMLAFLRRLARGPSPLVLVNLEDLWQELRPHNVPGTHHERPNWRRRALHGPEDFPALPEVEEAITVLRADRQLPCEFPDSDSPTILDPRDRALFRAGHHYGLAHRLGARAVHVDEVPGLHALHWAPGANAVSLVDVTRETVHAMEPRGDDLWEVFVPGAASVAASDPATPPPRPYRYRISRGGLVTECADPAARAFAPHVDGAPEASLACDLRYDWNDHAWKERPHRADNPRLIEVPAELLHEASAETLTQRILELAGTRGGVSVVLPSWMEHRVRPEGEPPLVGDFAPAAHLGTPQDVMRMVDTLHQHGVGVLLAWPPEGEAVDGRPVIDTQTHSPRALGTADPEDSNRGKAESYLLSSAGFWLEVYHLDGLRILTRRLRDRAGAGNPLLQAAEVLERLRTELAERHPRAQLLTGWQPEEDISPAGSASAR